MKPVDTIEACRTSHRLLLVGLAPLTDDDFRAPSLLPRYSRGHVVTHIANKSKAHALIFGVRPPARSDSSTPTGTTRTWPQMSARAAPQPSSAPTWRSASVSSKQRGMHSTTSSGTGKGSCCLLYTSDAADDLTR